ncbi:MAG: vacuolar family H+-ATPase subunit H [Lachnospiraceae bacterium]|jgi:vacuolar-type H+-ATPase subunit H|nr:vacuolar family H+-ATPase subunit H [Lachnospiraceae bacterium]
MVTSRIEQLVGDIEEFIDGCKFSLLDKSKILVNKEELEELLVELRMRIPDEIKKYQQIISNQEAIINDAQNKAENMLEQAETQTNVLVNEHTITQQAQETSRRIIEAAHDEGRQIKDAAAGDANLILEDAYRQARDLRQGAIAYADGLLKNIETMLYQNLEDTNAKLGGYLTATQNIYETVVANRTELSKNMGDMGAGQEG